MSKTERYLGYGLWGLVLFNAILAIAAASWQVTPGRLDAVIIVALWLLITCVLAGGGLAIVYRRAFEHWSTWLGLLALVIISGLAVQGALRPTDARLSLLEMLLFPMVGAALLVEVIFLLYRRDLGARLIAVLSLGGIWGLVIAWQSLGNIVEVIFQYSQTGKPTIFWWFNLFFCSSICLIPLAALSFSWHTILLIWRERQAAKRVGG